MNTTNRAQVASWTKLVNEFGHQELLTLPQLPQIFLNLRKMSRIIKFISFQQQPLRKLKKILLPSKVKQKVLLVDLVVVVVITTIKVEIKDLNEKLMKIIREIL